MKAVLIMSAWVGLGWLWVHRKDFKGIDFTFTEKITFRSIIDMIIMSPLVILLMMIIYLSSFIGITFNLWNTAKEFIDITYRFIPFRLKRKWLYHVAESENLYFTTYYIKWAPKELEPIIIQYYIDNNCRIDSDAFDLLKNGQWKWTYLNEASKKRDLFDYESEWLKEFIATERERKINEILDL
jgi:hypothetical protein